MTNRDVYFVYVSVSFVLCFQIHSTTTSGVFLKEIAILKFQKTYISQKSDTNFDIQYVLCSTEHCVYFMINVLSMKLKSM